MIALLEVESDRVLQTSGGPRQGYPPTTAAEEMFARRISARVSIPELAQALGLTRVDVGGLHRGRLVPAEAGGWGVIYAAIERLGRRE